MAEIIPLNGGLILQADSEDLGTTGCTELENVMFDKPGMIYKRPSRPLYTTNIRTLKYLIRWVGTDGVTYWIASDEQGIVHSGTGLDTSTLIVSPNPSFNSKTRILNHGNQLRFINEFNLSDFAGAPQIYQYIDRKFFWGLYEPTAAFLTDTATPSVYTPSNHSLGYANMSGFYSTNFIHTGTDAKDYTWKITAIYDGNQETPLPSADLGGNNNVINDTRILGVDDAVAIRIHIDKTTHNKRITGFNFYRSEDKGPYYKVCTASALGSDEDLNVQKAANGTYLGHVLVTSDNSFPSNLTYDGKCAFVNGYRFKLADSSSRLSRQALLIKHTGAGSTPVPANWNIWGLNRDQYPKDDIDVASNPYEFKLGTKFAPADNTEVGPVTGHSHTRAFFNNKYPWTGSAIDTTSPVSDAITDSVPSEFGGWFIGEKPTRDESNSSKSWQNGYWNIGNDEVDGQWDGNGGTFSYETDTANIHLSSFDIWSGTGLNPLSIKWADGTDRFMNLGFDPAGDHALSSDDILVCGFWLKTSDHLTGSNRCLTIGLVPVGQDFPTNLVATKSNIFVNLKACTATADNPFANTFKYVQAEVKVSDITGDTGAWSDESIDFRIEKNNTGVIIWINGLTVTKKIVNAPTGNIAMGEKVATNPNVALGSEDSHVGGLIAIGDDGDADSDTGYDAIRHNYSSSFKIYNDRPAFTNSSPCEDQSISIGQQYLWLTSQHIQDGTVDEYSATDQANMVYLHYVDKGDVIGAVHPTGETSIDVKYQYSVILSGRQYVGNVALNPDAENERHKDWVLFSELGQSDVIPITNYISIPDLQGGEITGLARLMSDLVVFQSKGIYRLSIPSADPFTWTLSESEPNIGCIAPDSIVEYENGIFFAGQDHIYHLSANFEATPITNTIRDEYQKYRTADTRISIDVKKGRLLCTLGAVGGGAVGQIVHVLDLSNFRNGQEHWSTMGFPGLRQAADFFTVDEDLNLYSVDSSSSSYISPFEGGAASEYVGMKRTTGWLSFGSDLEHSGVLRRINLKYLSYAPITIKVYTDGSDTVSWDSSAQSPAPFGVNSPNGGWQKARPGIRGRYFKIEISTDANDTDTAKLDTEIYRLEVEYE